MQLQLPADNLPVEPRRTKEMRDQPKRAKTGGEKRECSRERCFDADRVENHKAGIVES